MSERSAFERLLNYMTGYCRYPVAAREYQVKVLRSFREDFGHELTRAEVGRIENAISDLLDPDVLGTIRGFKPKED